MDEEIFRERIREIIRKRESFDPPRRLSRAWFDSICSWCGGEYNRLDTRSTYCSPKCKADSVPVPPKQVKKEPLERGAKPEKRAPTHREVRRRRMLDKLRQLAKEPGLQEWFMVSDAAFAWVITKGNAREWLLRMVEAGCVQSRPRGRSTDRQYRIDREHQLVKEAIK